MNRSVVTLLLVLLIQCAMIGAVYWPQQSTVQQPTHYGLVTLDPANIDHIRIEDEYDNETLLVKTGEQWLLPELEGLPANPAKVVELLASITAQDNSWPIAQSTTARQRFQVADYHFQRSISLGGGANNWLLSTWERHQVSAKYMHAKRAQMRFTASTLMPLTHPG